ncbi:MAG: hypothetical protein ACPH19_01340 [Flavobacteriaceae bacterium]
MNKHLLPLSSLLILLLTLSCKKEEPPHPLVGDWVRHSLSYEWGSKSERLIFFDDGTGESIYEMEQFCVDNISVVSGEIVTICSSFHYTSGLYKEMSNFSWKTEENLLTRIYESEQQEVITLVTSTETTAPPLLLDFDENEVFLTKDVFTRKGDILFLANPSQSNNNFLYGSGDHQLDTLRYRREY